MSQKKGHENDLKGLRLLHDHRWLRKEELGILMWPRQAASVKSAEKIIRKWRSTKKKWIIERPLPKGAGTAIVLSERGAAHIGVTTGKDWGRHERNEQTKVSEWKPPRKWKHELYQSSLCACLTRLGYKVITEHTIRPWIAKKDRIPDGIVTGDTFRCWLEVESARKSGLLLRRMIRNLMSVATVPETRVCLDIKVTGAMLAFSRTQKDERPYRLAHLSRAVSAIRKEAQRDIPLILAIMEVDNAGAVIDVTLAKYVVKCDEASRVLDNVDWVRDDDRVWHGSWKNGIEFTYWRDGDKELPWSWEASIRTYGPHGQHRELGSGSARTAEEAKRAAYEGAMRNLTPDELGD